MDNPQAQLADKLKSANHVLVTVSRDPSVDQLAALIGLTLLLNKAGKHAAAVFSGTVPSTIEFLQPDETIEKTTDSLRDFIIALDKSKADKLRYKVEDDVVRIFITPYKTSITQDDLDFSQGDFNVDVVVALGVTKQEDLDEAIVSHGRILHDATVATVNLSSEGDFGSIHWQEPRASSLSEMMTELARSLGVELVDNQIATAFLTGIVAETERFSNEKTTSQTMTASAVLMAAGANQQLVAAQLLGPETAATAPESDDTSQPDTGEDNVVDLNLDQSSEHEGTDVQPETETPVDHDGSLEIDHHNDDTADQETATTSDEDNRTLPAELVDAVTPNADSKSTEPAQAPEAEAPQPVLSEPSIEPEQPTDSFEQPAAGPVEITAPAPETSSLPELPSLNDQPAQILEPLPTPTVEPLADQQDRVTGGSRLITGTPTPGIGGQLTANSQTEALEASVDPLSAPVGNNQNTLLSRQNTLPVAQSPAMITGLTPPPPAWVPAIDNPLDLPSAAPQPSQTLSDLEQAVQTEESAEAPESLDAARDQVAQALNGDPSQPLPPVEALNAQPMLDNLHPQPAPELVTPTADQPQILPPAASGPSQEIPSLPLPTMSAATDLPSLNAPVAPAFDPGSFGITPGPGAQVPGSSPVVNPLTTPQVIDPNAAPPVPPPIPFNFGTPPQPPQA